MTTTPPRCGIVYEGDWAPELAQGMQADRSPDAVQRGLEAFAETLAGLVDRADEVMLVVPLGLAEAVMLREHNPGYHTDRGSGLVAARTMERPDGHVDVIIETGLLFDHDDEGNPLWTAAGMPRLNPTALESLQRTIIHEAQHVIMTQWNSDFDEYDTESHSSEFPWMDYVMAAKMCDEHRAEVAAIRASCPELPTSEGIVAVLSHLGTELAAADARYQTSELTADDIYQLREDVYNACIPYWTALAYWSAQFRTDNHLADPGPHIADLDLWKRYVGPTWTTLGEALAQLDVADLGATSASLQHGAVAVARWVAESLEFIGFRNVRTPQGDAFYIESS